MAHAQPRVTAAGVTLRPEPELRELAVKVAALLELRTGERVVVGEPPPPALPEAVAGGHLAMLRDQTQVRLVLGVPGGASLDTRVPLGSSGDAQVRAVALAVESIHDTAREEARAAQRSPAARAVGSQPQEAIEAAAPSPCPGCRSQARDGDSAGSAVAWPRVETLGYARVYGGASTSSSAPMAGIGAGVGLCVLRQCLVVAGEVPATTGSVDALDVRYRYLTFLSGFYTRPVSFGRFTPGATLAFLTRLGHFRADLGYRDTGLDTDLGARGSVELAWELFAQLDVMSEVGVDLTLDRHHLRTAEGPAARGERWSPWAQCAVRFRP
jgi:hypothetical protein